MSSGSNVALRDLNSIDLGASTVGGALTVTANGAITDSGNVLVAGTTTLAPGAGNSATLDSAGNDFGGPVGATNGANLTLVDANALDLGPIAITGTLSATAILGNITNTGGALSIGGNSTFTANAAGASITVANTGNTFTGTVGFQPSGGGLANVTVFDTTALDLQALTLSGALVVTAAGITQSGALDVTGTTSLTGGAGANITLGLANDFGGSVIVVSGNNVTLNDINALDLGASTISAALGVTASGAITDSGNVVVTGTTTLAAGAGITVDSAGNDFIGNVSLSSAGATDIAIVDANALSLTALSGGRDVSISAGTTATMLGAMTVAQDLFVNAGTLATGGFGLTVTRDVLGAGTLSATNAVNVGRNFGPAAFTANSSTVTLNTSAAAAVGSYTFFNLVIDKAALANTVTATGAWIVTNALTLTRGTLDAGAGLTHQVAGAWNSTSASFDFTENGSTIRLTTPGTTITTKGAADTFWNLVIDNGATLASAVSTANDLTLTTGSLGLADFNLTAGRHLTGGGGSSVVALAGGAQEQITVGGSFAPAAFTANGARVVLNGANAGSLGGFAFFDLVFNKTNQADTVTSTGALAVTNSLSMTRGTWDAATFTHDIRVPWDSSSASFTMAPSTSTVDLNTAASLTVATGGTNTLWNLIVRTNVVLGSAVVVLNDLAIRNTGNLDVSVANNWQVTVGHDWTRDLGGVFQSRQGTVVFNDNIFTANGALSTGDPAGETFYGLRVDEAGGTFTFNSPLTIIKELAIATGTLAEGAPGALTITMGTAASPNAAAPPAGGDAEYVIWRNQVGEAGFQAGDGAVVFADGLAARLPALRPHGLQQLHRDRRRLAALLPGQHGRGLHSLPRRNGERDHRHRDLRRRGRRRAAGSRSTTSAAWTQRAARPRPTRGSGCWR